MFFLADAPAMYNIVHGINWFLSSQDSQVVVVVVGKLHVYESISISIMYHYLLNSFFAGARYNAE